ncbi:MAG: ATP-binding domain-containing protein, partial [Oscillibacter sp.]|nr:ATP-binding domain-containing protein [Oscillibacter sp.]
LEQNYRSTQRILDAANAVIGNNEGRKGKQLWTENGTGEPVRVRAVNDENGEADFIAEEALDQVKKGGHFRDMAVLYRMNAQSNALEYAMKRNGIPYRIVGGMKFFDRAEVKDMLAYLCVVNNPLDDLRLRRIVNNPSRKIGAATLDRAAALAAEQGATLYEIFRNADFFPELKTAKAKLLAFADLIDGLRKKEKSMDLADFYDEVCQASGYVKMLEERKDAESQGRLDNVRELKSSIQGFLERSPEDRTLAGFLNEIALYTDLDGLEAGEDCVTMMTIHAAKGLEFPLVYVAGMEEGIFPGNSAQYSQEDMEEERRLCYVAMTRAKKSLTLVRAHHRMLYGRTGANPPSRFLEEIPEEYVRQEGQAASGWLAGGYGGSGSYGGYGGYSGGSFGSYGGTSSYGGSYGGTGSYGGGYGGTGSYGGSGSYGGGSGRRGGGTRSTVRSSGTDIENAPQSGGTAAGSEKSVVTAQFAAGDRVEHTAFGPGTVKKLTPMAGDVMAEVEFDGVGTKKLMLNYAGSKMKKVEE